jgi:hypothetical protein
VKRGIKRNTIHIQEKKKTNIVGIPILLPRLTLYHLNLSYH